MVSLVSFSREGTAETCFTCFTGVSHGRNPLFLDATARLHGAVLKRVLRGLHALSFMKYCTAVFEVFSGRYALSTSVCFFRGTKYEGFFLDQGRSGPGMLFKGNVKDVYDPKSGKVITRSNRVYEGNWRAGDLRPGSMVGLVTG